jgi:predicted Fe-S protein YdhL (DUF1289 family)
LGEPDAPDAGMEMALFPKIQSPCPYLDRLSSIMDGETCRVCKREVFDLTDMSDGERVAFMKGCSGEVCVTYRFPVRPAVAAAALAVAAIVVPTAVAACDATSETVVVTGGIKDPANAQYIQVPDGKAVPNLPVVYEDGNNREDAGGTAQGYKATDRVARNTE